jgi:hypothetical protein
MLSHPMPGTSLMSFMIFPLTILLVQWWLEYLRLIRMGANPKDNRALMAIRVLFARRNHNMNSALAIHRLQFAFTAAFHYIFPQLTMGLALMIVVLKAAASFHNDDVYDATASFWTRVFAINFALGIVTGTPMEFQSDSGHGRRVLILPGMFGASLRKLCRHSSLPASAESLVQLHHS